MGNNAIKVIISLSLIFTFGITYRESASASHAVNNLEDGKGALDEVLPALIVQVEDSLGNINTNSFTGDGTGDWSCQPDCPDLDVHIGETISFTVTAADPNDLPIEYKFVYWRFGAAFLAQDWSSDNTLDWHVSQADVGPHNGVGVYVRNNDGEEYQGVGSGDDYNYEFYSVHQATIYLPIIIK